MRAEFCLGIFLGNGHLAGRDGDVRIVRSRIVRRWVVGLGVGQKCFKHFVGVTLPQGHLGGCVPCYVPFPAFRTERLFLPGIPGVRSVVGVMTLPLPLHLCPTVISR